MSISSAYNIARSGLRVTEGRADLVAGNIANAQTPGYARRDGVQTSAGSGQGDAVDLRAMRQVNDRLAGMTRTARAEQGAAAVPADVLNGYLLTLGEPGDEASPAARLANFQAGLDLLGNNPGDVNAQGDALARAEGFVNSLTTASRTLEQSRAQAAESFDRSLGEINTALSNVAALNAQLRQAGDSPRDTGGLMDQMSRTLDALGSQMDFKTRWEADGSLTLHTTGGTELVSGADAVRLTGDNRTGGIFAEGNDVTPDRPGGRGISSGRLAGLSEMLSTVLPQMRLQLDELARGMIQGFEAADLSLAPGDPGLFTDAGAAFDPARLDGLAGRLAINDRVRPDSGGALWRLRDGMSATAPGEAGTTMQVNAFIKVFDDARGIDPRTGLGATARLGDFAASLVGHQQNVRVSADARADSASVRLATFEDNRSAVEGVNIDTELQKLLEIEQAYGANSQVLSSLSSMIDTLLSSV